MPSPSNQPIQQINVSELDGTNGFTVTTNEAVTFLGQEVSSGDVNGDGFDDLIIGALSSLYAVDGQSKVYVVFGQAEGSGTAIDVSTLNGNNGFVINLDQTFAPPFVGPGSGLPVSSAGDVNGDGIDDIIFATYPYDASESYVVFGQADGFSASLNVSSLNGNNGFTINGSEGFIASVSSAGDINGDGIDDLILGTENFNSSPSQSYVVFGSAQGFDATLDLSALDGSNGFVITGADGGISSVSSVGDINADGLDDFVIASTSDSYVVFGQTGGFSETLDLSTLDGSNGFTIERSQSRPIEDAANAGDVNGDGIDDLILGSPNADPNDRTDAGTSYVVFGQAGGFEATLRLSTLDGNNGFAINGIDAFDESGSSVSSAGDVNGDGFDDVIIAANLNSYVVFGGEVSSPTLELAELDGTNGFIINGFDGIGSSVSSAGDVNGDGFDDVIVGAPATDPQGQYNAGESYVIFGGDFTGEVSVAGTQGDDWLLGTADTDVIIGDLGNDILAGRGGSDVLKGAVGDDILAVRNLNFQQLEGDSGSDTLYLVGSNLNLNLTAIADRKITGIEEIDLNPRGNNSLTFDVLDVLALSDTTNQLIVSGNAGDTVTSTGQGWIFDSTTNVDGILYNQYTVGEATLLVNAEITQTIT